MMLDYFIDLFEITEMLSRRTSGMVPIVSSKLDPEVQTCVLEMKVQKQHKCCSQVEVQKEEYYHRWRQASQY